MPTYLGYKSRGAGIIKWSEQTKMLNENIQQALNVRGLEREAYDEIEQTNIDAINSYEIGQNQKFNEYVLRGADNVRTQMYEWNQAAKRGEITRADYKSRMNNSMSDWSSFAKAAKNFDAKHEQMLERQRKKEGSVFEAEINKHNAMMADLANKGFYINPTTGRIYSAEYDENGVIANATGATQLQMPGNLLDDALDLATSISKHVETYGDWKKFEALAGGATKTTESKRLMEDYERLVETTIDTYMTDNRTIAKILVDNGTGEYAWDEDQMKSKIDAKVEREKEIRERLGTMDDFDESEFRSELEASYVLIGQDETSTYQPQITEAQIELARKRVRDEIDKQTGMKESRTGGSNRPSNNKKNNNGGNGGFATYSIIKKAWETGDVGLMTSSNPNYVFEKSSDGYGFNVYPSKYNTHTEQYEKASSRPIQTARSADELSRFFFKSYKESTPEDQFYSEQRAYNEYYNGGSSNSNGGSHGGNSR